MGAEIETDAQSLTKTKANLGPGSVTQHLVIYFVQNIHSLSWYKVF